MKKRRPDGSKNRHNSRGRRPGEPLLREGYQRKYYARVKGQAANMLDLIYQLGNYVAGLAAEELEEQLAGEFRRPFNSFAEQPFAEGGKLRVSLQGASPGEPEYEAMRPETDCIFAAKQLTLSDVLTARLAALAEATLEMMERQNAEGCPRRFSLGTFVDMLDTGHRLHFLVEARPDSLTAILDGFTQNEASEG